MSVILRGNKFHYRFQIGGQPYSGVCEGGDVRIFDHAKAERLAEAFEASVRERAAKEIAERKELENNVRKNKTVTVLIENYRYELTGGKPVTLAGAFDLAASKPSRRQCHETCKAQKRLYWSDFAAFMAAKHPDVFHLAQVRKAHCESFVQLLTTQGRFVKEVSCTRPGKTPGQIRLLYPRLRRVAEDGQGDRRHLQMGVLPGDGRRRTDIENLQGTADSVHLQASRTEEIKVRSSRTACEPGRENIFRAVL